MYQNKIITETNIFITIACIVADENVGVVEKKKEMK